MKWFAEKDDEGNKWVDLGKKKKQNNWVLQNTYSTFILEIIKGENLFKIKCSYLLS